MLVLNLPIVFVVACLLAHHFVNLTPRSNFERLVGKPIPKSVQNLQQSGFLAMDSIFWVLYFKISPTDEERLVSDQHFTLASDTGENNHFVLNELIRTHSRLGVEITTNWQAYFLGKEKHLFFNTNDSEAVFVLDVH
jgi:hypothetical protein